MFLQLLRIVSGANTMQSNNATSSFQYFNRQKKNQVIVSQYYRLFLFRDMASKSGQVVYIIEGKCMNDQLWYKNTILCDSGAITIGTIIAIFNPWPVKNMLGNEIPILETHGGFVVMKKPEALKSIDVDEGITMNTTRSFVLANVSVDVLVTY